MTRGAAKEVAGDGGKSGGRVDWMEEPTLQ